MSKNNLLENALEIAQRHAAQPIKALLAFAEENDFVLVREKKESALIETGSDSYSYRDEKYFHLITEDDVFGLDLDEWNEGFSATLYDFKNQKNLMLYYTNGRYVELAAINDTKALDKDVVNQTYKLTL